MRTLDDVQPSYRIRPQPGDVVVLKTDYSGRTTGDLGIIINVWRYPQDFEYSVLLVDGGPYVPMQDSDFEVIDTSLRGVVGGWLYEPIDPIDSAVGGWIEPIDPIDSANVASAYKFIQERMAQERKRMAVEPTTPLNRSAESSVITVQGRKVRVTLSGDVLSITCAECSHVLGTLPIEDFAPHIGKLIYNHQ